MYDFFYLQLIKVLVNLTSINQIDRTNFPRFVSFIHPCSVYQINYENTLNLEEQGVDSILFLKIVWTKWKVWKAEGHDS